MWRGIICPVDFFSRYHWVECASYVSKETRKGGIRPREGCWKFLAVFTHSCDGVGLSPGSIDKHT